MIYSVVSVIQTLFIETIYWYIISKKQFNKLLNSHNNSINTKTIKSEST